MKNKVLHSRIKDVIRPNMFFLNIGANDGKWDDPFYDYVIEKKWRGFAIEPTTVAFEKLKKNLASNPSVQCVNAAITPEKIAGEDKRIFWTFSDEALKAEPGLSMMSSYNRHNLELYAELVDITAEFAEFRHTRPDIAFNLINHITEMKLPEEFTLQEFIMQKKITHIDAVNIDAEQMDYALFKAFDFGRFLPAIFVIETVHFTKDQQEDFESTMQLHGYMFRTKYKEFSDVYVIPPKN